MKDVLNISKPKEAALPLIFDSPHSGHTYPSDFNHACDFKTLEAAEDKYVDDLFANAPNHGGTLLCALFPRSYIDTNRAENDIDLQLVEGKWPEGEITPAPSPRSNAGIGLIRRLVRPGIPVYNRTLSPDEIIKRIEKYYRPYHSALKDLIDDAHYNFGQVYHINCHSMPNASAYPKRGIGLVGNKAKPSDFVLGDRNGTSCSTLFTRGLRDFIKELGYTVTINDPFKGVELVEEYSDPSSGRHSLQLEINKSLYMDEKTGKKLKKYEHFKQDVEKIISFCASYCESQLTDLAAD